MIVNTKLLLFPVNYDGSSHKVILFISPDNPSLYADS